MGGGLVARVLETVGISTVCIATSADHIAPSRPPRTVVVRHPRGATMGEPGSAIKQVEVLKDALDALAEMTEPGQVQELPYRWRVEA